MIYGHSAFQADHIAVIENLLHNISQFFNNLVLNHLKVRIP